jgi:HECT-domain (ubiquitin-transferase)
LLTPSDPHPRLVTEWKIQKRVSEQFNAFITGFNELIPADLVNVFDERELELLIGGIADIDVDDWKKHTDYRGYQEQDEVIQNFWKVIRTWDAEQKSRLLQFATGTSRIPVNGFKDLQGSDGPRRFTIEKAGEVGALPKSHTWYVFFFPAFFFSLENNPSSQQCANTCLFICLLVFLLGLRLTQTPLFPAWGKLQFQPSGPPALQVVRDAQ